MHRDDIYSFYPEQIAIPAGVTAVIPALPGQNAVVIKYVSGGSLLFVGSSSTYGSTYAIAQSYLFGTGEVFSAQCSGALALFAVGSTAVCHIVRGKSAGQ